VVDRIAQLMAAFALAALCAWAQAVPADPALDPTLEAHVTRLTQELRCLVCQNQTIADSTADLALDLKQQVREQLAQGRSDQQVIDFMVQRYGDFVLYRPPVKRATWLLWFGPALLLMGGLGFLLLKIRKQTAAHASADAAPDAQAASVDEGVDEPLFDDLGELADHPERRLA
jgi:cytochrome c-type biogenesis protein CcmH